MIIEEVKELTAEEQEQVRKVLDSVLPNASDRLPVIDNRSSSAESYGVVRTSMLLSTAGNPPKTILVTSGQPGEGKTTTVVNTAISLAQLGASTLIIDCDLRKPSAHNVFGVEHDKGLSTYLSCDIEFDELIVKLQIPNLYLLPSGPIPPNPDELINSERMKNLLRILSERYDHVLVDSPPLIHVTDAVILSSLVDGVILVVHGGKGTRAVTERARQELASVGAKVFGVVLNNVDLKRNSYESSAPRMTEEELQQRLLKKGIISRIPPRIRDADFYANRKPIEVEGKPVSEIIIEERR